jgi:hypothetical protein
VRRSWDKATMEGWCEPLAPLQGAHMCGVAITLSQGMASPSPGLESWSPLGTENAGGMGVRVPGHWSPTGLSCPSNPGHWSPKDPSALGWNLGPRWGHDVSAQRISGTSWYRVGRAGGIRTHGLFVPNEARYQTAPQPALSAQKDNLQVRPCNPKDAGLTVWRGADGVVRIRSWAAGAG